MITRLTRLLFDADEGAGGGSGEGEGSGEGSGERELAGAAATSALKKERKARQDAEKQARELAARLKKLEDAEKSEVERLRQEAEEATRRVTELEAQHERESAAQRRSDIVRRAAKEFAEPEDAIALLAHRGELEAIDDEKDAERALKALARERPHLLKKQGAGTGLEQVLKDGIPLDQQAKDALNERTDIIPQAKLMEMSAEDIAVLKIRNRPLFDRSMAALTGTETVHQVV